MADDALRATLAVVRALESVGLDDRAYLDRWATELGLRELLDEAFVDAGGSLPP